jgi:AraC family transcriptional regulator
MKPATELDYRRRIARVIEAILLNPAAPHTVESLAAVAHFSPYHFHRIYRALTGEGLADTVQRLRLAQAAHRLTDAAGSVSAIALDVGYESPQAFARAFRGFTGVSPRAFQERQQNLAIPGTSQEMPAAPDPQSGDAAPPRVELMELPPADALCLLHTGPPETIGQTFRTLLQRQGEGAQAAARRRIGICFGDPEVAGRFRYLAGIVQETPAEPVEAMESVRIEGGLYAVHRLVGPYALIAPTFRALFGGWLPRSGYEPDDRPALEVYRSPPRFSMQHACVTDLMIPIRKV